VRYEQQLGLPGPQQLAHLVKAPDLVSLNDHEPVTVNGNRVAAARSSPAMDGSPGRGTEASHGNGQGIEHRLNRLAETAHHLKRRQVLNEPFSSCGFAGLQDVDGFGEVACAPGAAAQFAQDVPGLSWALARSPGARSRAWALFASFWEAGLFRPRYGVSSGFPAPW
jgi:hypothetical protein